MQDQDALPFLDPPLQLVDLPEDEPFDVQVVRWEVGRALVPFRDRTGSVLKPVIRLHTPAAIRGYERPYLDFAHQLAVRRILQLYKDLITRWRVLDPVPRIILGQQIRGDAPDFITLRLIRRHAHPDSSYEVHVV